MHPHSSFRQLLHGVGLVVVAALLVLTGCSAPQSPLAPPASPGIGHRISAQQFIPLTFTRPLHTGRLTKPVATTSPVLAETGGTVLLAGEFYQYRLMVPAGAVAQDTELSITLPDDANILADLGPEGTQFATPVTFEITIDTANTNYALLEQSLDVFWYNPATGVWEGQGATFAKQESTIIVTASLSHFSQYALGGQSPTP